MGGVFLYMLPSKWIIQELSTIPSDCQQSRSVLGNVENYLLSLESLGIVENPEVDLGNVVCRQMRSMVSAVEINSTS